MMTAAETYAARIDAVQAQRARLHGTPPPQDPWGGLVARRFRADPHRQLDANLAVLASYTRPEDVLIDVGGGAGRVALPLALRCREVITWLFRFLSLVCIHAAFSSIPCESALSSRASES